MVTLKSWDELWLNEGFACYFENTKLHNTVENGLNMNQYNLLLLFEGALKRDSFPSTRPLSAMISTPSEVQETVDEKSYAKENAIISMTLENLYELEDDGEEKKNIITGMACANNISYLKGEQH
ncbi:hypothetical protein ANCDUO_07692 [Ancylostoma duodenale]|uniref:Peptidase M1 membrane alanine aminopeptidase domain-containing protein n=1 Tax=Ancylostoma duodenale TaxID=51022 RepID=A0A0C2DHT0_9BILA|nr:hypothetical protein ANCDUO_07692 [Ancylostoma duodenale]